MRKICLVSFMHRIVMKDSKNKFEWILGYPMILFARWLLMAAIAFGGYLKEAVEVILDFFLG